MYSCIIYDHSSLLMLRKIVLFAIFKKNSMKLQTFGSDPFLVQKKSLKFIMIQNF